MMVNKKGADALLGTVGIDNNSDLIESKWQQLRHLGNLIKILAEQDDNLSNIIYDVDVGWKAFYDFETLMELVYDVIHDVEGVRVLEGLNSSVTLQAVKYHAVEDDIRSIMVEGSTAYWFNIHKHDLTAEAVRLKLYGLGTAMEDFANYSKEEWDKFSKEVSEDTTLISIDTIERLEKFLKETNYF